MIKGFGDAETADIFNGVDSKRARKRLAKELWNVAHRKLDQIHAAKELRDLRAPPGNRLEELVGDRAGYYSIRINDQFRVVFKFNGGDVSEVKVEDYH